MIGTEEEISMPAEIAKSNREKKKVYKPDSYMHTSVSKKLFVSFLSLSLILLLIIALLLSTILIDLKNEEKKTLSFFKTVVINTEPSDANLYINNLYVGISPLGLENINISSYPILKIKKEGFKDYSVELNENNTNEPLNIVLESTTNSSTSNSIKWSDYGLNIKAFADARESLSLETASCKEVKQFLIDSKLCPSDDSNLDYNGKVLTFIQNNNKINMNVKLLTNKDNCEVNSSKCNSKNVKKIDSIQFLNQNIDVYENNSPDKISIFLQPLIKNKGNEFNGFYLEFNGPVDYKTVLSMITPNA